MSDYQSENHRHFFLKLSKYARNNFTGRLSVTIEHTASWRIYFSSGSIVWASGGIHPVRRWLRQLKACNCEIIVPKNMTKEELLSSPYECWDYFALSIFMQENQITPEQVKYVVEGVISEVLFDIVQAFAQVSPKEVDQIQMLRKQGINPCDKELLLPAWLWRTEAAKQRILATWNSWVSAGLNYYSPNSGLAANQEKLKSQGWNSLAQYFIDLENTKKTLRDIAVDNEKNVLSILRTMKGYLNQGLIKFKSVPDLWEQARQDARSYRHSGISQGQLTGPLVKANTGSSNGKNNETTPRSLTTPMSGWRDNSLKISRSSELEEGVKVNVMEDLVAKEATQQIKALPLKTANCINKLDVITYALNRLPPLYASSKEGIAHQTKQAKEYHADAITLAVKRAIAIVKQDPIRRSTRITSQEDKNEMFN